MGSIAENLKAAREQAGFTCEQVSLYLGEDVRIYESGVPLSLCKLEKLADLYGCHLAYLIDGSGEPARRMEGVGDADKQTLSDIAWAHRFLSNLIKLGLAIQVPR